MPNPIFYLKMIARYWLYKDILPSWDLKMHAVRSIAYKNVSTMFPKTTEEDIEDIDYDGLHEYFANNDISYSTLLPEKGVYRDIEFPVSEIPIDLSWFKNMGLAEDMICKLTELDNVESNRIIKAEIVASWNVAEHHEMNRSSDREKLLAFEPLTDTESIILHMHGGYFAFGSPGSHRKMVGRMSDETLLRCITIDYRKAPKYPFPAQLHDALISFLYLIKRGFKIENIVLSSDSAGAQIVISLLFLLRRFNMHNIRAAIFISPPSDLSDASNASIRDNKPYDYLYVDSLEMPTSAQRLFYKPGAKFTPEYVKELKDPFVSSIYGDFSDFPNTLIQVGEKELLYDQSYDLYEKIKAANPDKTILFQSFKDMIHVFHQFTFRPESDEAFAKLGEFVKHR